MRIKTLLATAAMAIALGAIGFVAAKTQSPATRVPDTTQVHYRTVDVDGINIFYREAGDPDAPAILLLHGFPSSSSMFRDLIPQLAGFHVIAPDYPGSGNSEAPSADKFDPTFENLARVMDDFVVQLGLKHYVIYMQDFGGPVGFRIAVKHPERVTGLIVQNANAYEEGIAPEVLKGIRERVGALTPKQQGDVEGIVSRDFAMFLYQTGASNPSGMNPDAWNLDSWTLKNPDAHQIQAALLVNYYTNLLEYPKWQEFLRTRQPRTLIVWGEGDPVFLPAGAEAYKRDVPGAELHYYRTSHFALEEEAPAIADNIQRFFGR